MRTAELLIKLTKCCRVRAVEVPCVLNIAAVKLKSKEYDEAVYECNKVLDIEVSRVRLPIIFSIYWL